MNFSLTNLPSFILQKFNNNNYTSKNKHITLLHNFSSLLQSKNIPKNPKLEIFDPSHNKQNYYKSTHSLSIIDSFNNIDNKFPTFIPFEYKTTSYFTIPFNNRDKIIHAIMTANDPIWLILPDKTKEKIIYNLRIDLSKNFNMLYNHSVYRFYFSKENNTLPSSKDELYTSIINNNIDISPVFIHLLSDYLNVNILQVSSKGYQWLSIFIIQRATIIIWTNESETGCILHKNYTEHIRPITENNPILLHFQDLFEDRTFKINIAYNPKTSKLDKFLKTKSFIDLKNMALNHNISLKDNCDKNKTKHTIIKELLIYLSP